jgi:hypothetical protein
MEPTAIVGDEDLPHLARVAPDSQHRHGVTIQSGNLALTPGTRLGVYEVGAQIGEGEHAHRRVYRRADWGQTVPWCGAGTRPMPLNTNFCRRLPSQVSVV